MAGEDPVRGLREALALSPENVRLRQHLAETLLGMGRPEEAEQEFRQALSRQPDDPALKLGLAQAFFRQDKDSHALVIVEELVSGAQPPARVFMLHARLLLRSGDVQQAVQAYRRGVELDASAVDRDLATMLGIGAEPEGSGDVVEGKLRAGWSEPAAGPALSPELPAIDFSDIGGLDALKEEIRLKIIYPLQHPDMYRAYGKAAGGGILMYGPPGCGKTYLARATAGEIQARFLSVGFSDVLDMWIGASERNLHQLFEQARAARPCVLFFDEVDALGASRADMRHSAGRHLINQFLSELDGVQASNEGILILGATNAPWHLDGAFRRPGRFDRVLFVPPPDAPAREAILNILCRGKPADSLDYPLIASKTDGFSGADLKAMLDVAVEAKLREAMKIGAPRPLSSKDLLGAAASVRPSTHEWFSTARNYALYANQSGLYNEILRYLKLER